MNKKLLAALFGSALMLAACGGGGDEEATETNEENGGEVTESADAEAIVQESCIACHGGDLGGQGQAPALSDVGSRLSEEEILDVIENGRGGMPAHIIEGAEAEVVAEWLATKK